MAKKIKVVHSWYVDIETSIVYQLPNTVDGDTPYVVKPKFYKITEKQARSLAGGAKLDEVIREAAEIKIMAEVAKVKAEAAPLKEPEEPKLDRPKTEPKKKVVEKEK